ncbi:MAG TPA: TadE family protein [Noviherbaspirillum sp.]|uniref:TadE/TadG family type IV pilus assembly protein n=1 Tax=Noviherbaspirillum sp. TaxID=1926288 RepID=UPI002B49E1D3|nr:TadE family protein [Noviherbaspirillum sp.]HJV84030.1 TadE family protein [Noviherbaspirillum sp.]
MSRTQTSPQRGAATVEFALVAVAFLTVIFGIIEMGRLFYLWNTVQEVTRRAAREAVVRYVWDAPAIQRYAVFQPGTTGDVKLPAAGEISNLAVSIRYLNNVDASGAGVVADPLPADPVDNITACVSKLPGCINFVEASVCTMQNGACTPVQYVPLFDMWPFSLFAVDIPGSTVVMPAESLGLL